MENTTRLLPCTRCGKTKPENCFHQRKSRKRGYHYHCKECNSKYTKSDRGRELSRKRTRACVNRLKATDPVEYKRRNRRYNLHKFGMTPERYEEMLVSQGGVCAICKGPPDTTNFHVDHNHTTGTIRGLLCSACNTAIGLLKEDAEIFQSAVSYLNDSPV